MVQCIAALFCGFDGDRKAFLDVVLACKFAKTRRAQVAVGIAFVKRAFLRGNYTLVFHILVLGQ